MKKEMWFIIGGLVILVIIFFANIMLTKKEKDENLLSGKYYVEIKIKQYGTMIAELDADNAPITVTNFVNLVKNNFYDGLTFHRIIEGFMMQGGQENEQSDLSLVKTIKGEFSSNNVDNPLKHERGTLSMARTNVKDSASTQFFIVQETSPHLDGEYAAFGHLLSGIEIVDKICKETPVEDENGTVLEKNQPVIESIRLIDKSEIEQK